MWFEVTVLSAATALVLEAAVGYPPMVHRAIAHPVVWIGAMIGRLDQRFNRVTLPDGMRRLNGILVLFAVVAAASFPAIFIQYLALILISPLAAALLLGFLAATLLAQRSLAEHVVAVARSLEDGGLIEARAAVAHIVGRETESLDQSSVARAAIESLAENFSDSVVAPIFWATWLGLPGIAAFKAINTADSMVGHRTKRYKDFGWAAARIDDLVNLPASRLTAIWLILAAAITPGARAIGALRAVLRDARKHESPNAGWPEAAMAGALGFRLGGPRRYAGRTVEGAWMGSVRSELDAADIRRALRLYYSACLIQVFAVALAAALILAI